MELPKYLRKQRKSSRQKVLIQKAETANARLATERIGHTLQEDTRAVKSYLAVGKSLPDIACVSTLPLLSSEMTFVWLSDGVSHQMPSRLMTHNRQCLNPQH